jgi:NADH:ubiquinone oxidoreductase subunit 6 (subunit J)
MNPPRLALALILLSFALAAMAFLTGCQSLGDAQVCVRTDYGTFCYDLPKPTSSK